MHHKLLFLLLKFKCSEKNRRIDSTQVAQQQSSLVGYWKRKHQWVHAFIIFQGKTVESREADLAIRMAKHYEVVHDLMLSHQDWWYYDVTFRQ